MGLLKKDEIIKNLTDKEVYDIDYDFAIKETQDIAFSQCHKYSVGHYKTVYKIIEAKLNTITDKDDKIAYLNCLSVNYTSLAKVEIWDIILSLATGGFLGISFIDDSNDIIYKTAAIVCAIAVTCIKVYVATTRKWSFYDKLFEHLKNNID